MTMSSDMRFPPGKRGHGGRSATRTQWRHLMVGSVPTPARPGTAVHPGGGNDLITRPGGRPSPDADEVLGIVTRVRTGTSSMDAGARTRGTGGGHVPVHGRRARVQSTCAKSTGDRRCGVSWRAEGDELSPL